MLLLGVLFALLVVPSHLLGVPLLPLAVPSHWLGVPSLPLAVLFGLPMLQC